MRIRQLQPCPGFDTPVALTETLCAKFYESGYRYVMRYTPWWRDCVHEDPEPDFQGWFFGLSKSELRTIMNSGLALGLIQMMHKSVKLDYKTGTERGLNLVANARALGLPEGSTLWIDGEYKDADAVDVIAFLSGAGEAISKVDRAGLYWGYEGISSEQLYNLPYYHSYMRAGMMYLADPQPRSYTCYQGVEQVTHGIDIDPSFQTYDGKRDRAWFVCP